MVYLCSVCFSLSVFGRHATLDSELRRIVEIEKGRKMKG